MGDPLLGPSAIDAIAMGCMFINPLYAKPGIQSTAPYLNPKQLSDLYANLTLRLLTLL